MTVYQRYYAELEITSLNQNFNVDNGTSYDVELTAGKYFLAGYDGESGGGSPVYQLCEHISQASSGKTGNNDLCTIDKNTGIVTLFFGEGLAGNHTVTWTDTALRDFLGFDGDLSGAFTYIAPNQARFCWLPSIPITDYPGDLTEWWETRSTSRLSRSTDGTTYGVTGNLLYEGEYLYENMPIEDVIYNGDTPWATYEKFWLDSAHINAPIRVFPDRDDNAAYVTAMMLPTGSETGEPVTIGAYGDYRSRMQDDFNGRWDVEFMLVKHVTA